LLSCSFQVSPLILPPSDDGVTLFIWGNAESCVTIIAASIPILRVLVREVKDATRRYYGTNVDTATTARRINLRSQMNTVATGPRSRVDKQDDWSEKSILDGKTSTGRGL